MRDRYLILEAPGKGLGVNVQVGIDDILGDVREGTEPGDAGVVERHVKSSELLDRRVHHLLAVGFLRRQGCF